MKGHKIYKHEGLGRPAYSFIEPKWLGAIWGEPDKVSTYRMRGAKDPDQQDICSM